MSRHPRRHPVAGTIAAVAVTVLVTIAAVLGIGRADARVPASTDGTAVDVAELRGDFPPLAQIPGFEDVCVPDPRLADEPTEAVPPRLAPSLELALLDPALATARVSASVWIDGYGEVLAHEPDLPLLPASNEKLYTAIGVHEYLRGDSRLETRVLADGPVENGVLVGDLVVVGGGDPTLAREGPHSLDALAAQIRDRGVVAVTGALRYDESLFDGPRTAEGWLERHVPANIGPQSAFIVDGNRSRADPGYRADPARGNAEAFFVALARAGVRVDGGIAPGPGAGRPVATLASPTVDELTERMLSASDNVVAEALLRHVGAAARGEGSVPAAVAAIDAFLDEQCLAPEGTAADGSGLSRANLRSAREWRTALGLLTDEPWFDEFAGALPLGGRSGTLAGRFRGSAAEGNVRAKTGAILGGIALSGYLATADGRDAVFSILVNGPDARGATGAVDAFVAGIAAVGAEGGAGAPAG